MCIKQPKYGTFGILNRRKPLNAGTWYGGKTRMHSMPTWMMLRAFIWRFEEDICFPTDDEGPDESDDEEPGSALMSTGETISTYIPTG
jgi:hypothetical protein